MQNRPVPPFYYGMSRRACIIGWCYLPVHVFLLPLLLGIYASVTMREVDDLTLNVMYYGVSLLAVLIFAWHFLRKDFDIILDNKLLSLLTMVTAYFISLLLSYAALFLLNFLLADVVNPNNQAVEALTEISYTPVFGLTVFAAPIVEEVLYRGAVFGSIRKRSRILAYAVSTVLFSLSHVWQYALVYNDPALLIYAIQYVPLSIALAYCYDRSSSIWTPIFFHMASNALSMLVLSYL